MATKMSSIEEQSKHVEISLSSSEEQISEPHYLGVDPHDAAAKKYFTSFRFIGTILSVGIGLVGATGSYSMAAPILSIINKDIGPNPNYVWIGLVNTLMTAIGSTIVGRLSDLFGRRWFFICGNILAILGNIVASQAHSIPTLIGANVLIGLAVAVQTSTPIIIGEIVPLKDRYLVIGLMYLFCFPGNAFGPAIAFGFVLHTSIGWRWIYYMFIITNTIATIGLFFCYYPPDFHMKTNKRRMDIIKEFDFVGLLLFVPGLLLFLMGLSWGGSVYPWKSGHVIGTMVAGGLSLVALGVYESLAKLKVPLVPVHLFKNFGWLMTLGVMTFASVNYYALAIIFPQMVFGIYTSDLQYGSILCCAPGLSFMTGLCFAGLSRYIGKQKWQMVACSLIATPLLGAVACATTHNKDTIIGLIVPALFVVGYMDSIAVTSASLAIKNQAEIGTAVGLSFTVRTAGSTMGATIFITVLKNRLAATIPAQVPPALVAAGLPASSVPLFLQGLTTGKLSTIPGINNTIIAAGTYAYQLASVYAFRTVFLTTLGFGGCLIIFSFLFPNLDYQMTNQLATTLHTAKSKATPELGINEKGINEKQEHVGV